MPQRRHPDEDRQRALDLYRERGPAEASRQTGIAAKTIATWARRESVKMDSDLVKSHLQRAAAVGALTLKARRIQFADELHEGAVRMFLQAWKPAMSRHWGVESTYDERGRMTGTRPVLVEQEIPAPSFADQKAIFSAMAIALDRSLKLTGDDAPTGDVNVLVLVQRALADLPAEVRALVAARLDTIDVPANPAA